MNSVGGRQRHDFGLPDGKAAQVVVENLNVRGEGVFKRVPAEK
jgi:hypothetical protein